MARRKIADVAVEVLKENNLDHVGYSTFGLMDDIFHRAKDEGICKDIGSRGGRLNPHPQNRHQVVLNALNKDTRFEKKFMRCTNGRAEVLVRSFYLKKLEATGR